MEKREGWGKSARKFVDPSLHWFTKLKNAGKKKNKKNYKSVCVKQRIEKHGISQNWVFGSNE